MTDEMMAYLNALAERHGLSVRTTKDFDLFATGFELGRKWRQWSTKSQEAYDLDDNTVMPTFEQWCQREGRSEFLC